MFCSVVRLYFDWTIGAGRGDTRNVGKPVKPRLTQYHLVDHSLSKHQGDNLPRYWLCIRIVEAMLDTTTYSGHQLVETLILNVTSNDYNTKPNGTLVYTHIIYTYLCFQDCMCLYSAVPNVLNGHLENSRCVFLQLHPQLSLPCMPPSHSKYHPTMVAGSGSSSTPLGCAAGWRLLLGEFIHQYNQRSVVFCSRQFL